MRGVGIVQWHFSFIWQRAGDKKAQQGKVQALLVCLFVACADGYQRKKKGVASQNPKPGPSKKEKKRKEIIDRVSAPLLLLFFCLGTCRRALCTFFFSFFS
ncbi:hypothetical protein TW95_gp1255 [Pandoravirus inopinatum]|uniref:Uncharacterized protein n=1 Tax=Pandoravirus inopinatum TaxID=1605721 RepID=A0A0B5J325_9VIRU|nr:hypothetical protein TW95_gp1255 [Pandoravirus inopinatum]AJF97989.1 hypothetical protein [Pandoravirus inopinatum]